MYVDLSVYYPKREGNSFLRFKDTTSSIDASEAVVLMSHQKDRFTEFYNIPDSKTLILDFSYENIYSSVIEKISSLRSNFKVYTNGVFLDNPSPVFNFSNIHVEPFFLTHLDKYTPIQETKSSRKHKDFLYMVGKNRPHRVKLLKELYKKNLLDGGYVSYFFEEEKNFGSPSYLVTLEDDCLNLPLNSSLDVESLTFEVSHSLSFNREYYDLVDFVIVAETECDNNRFFFTEKITKCILLNKRFLLLSSPNALLTLKSECQRYLNLDISHLTDWVDTSYDSEENLDKRIEMIVREVQKNTTIYNKKLI